MDEEFDAELFINNIQDHDESENFFFDFNEVICIKTRNGMVRLHPRSPKMRKCECHYPANELSLITGTIFDDKVKIESKNFKPFKARMLIIYKQEGETWEKKIQNYVRYWCTKTIDNPIDVQPYNPFNKLNELLKTEEEIVILEPCKSMNIELQSKYNQSKKKNCISNSELGRNDCILWRFNVTQSSNTKFIPIINGIDCTVHDKLYFLTNDSSKFKVNDCAFNLENINSIDINSNDNPSAIGIYENILYISYQGKTYSNISRTNLSTGACTPNFYNNLNKDINRIIPKGLLVYIGTNSSVFIGSQNGQQIEYFQFNRLIDIAVYKPENENGIGKLYILVDNSVYEANLETGDYMEEDCLISNLKDPKSITYVHNSGNPHLIIADYGRNMLVDINITTKEPTNIDFYNYSPAKLTSFNNDIFCISWKDFSKTDNCLEKISNSISTDYCSGNISYETLEAGIGSMLDLEDNSDIINTTLLDMAVFLLCHPFKEDNGFKNIIQRMGDILLFLQKKEIKDTLANVDKLYKFFSQFNKEDLRDINLSRNMIADCDTNMIGKIGVINEDENKFSNITFQGKKTIGVITNNSSYTANHQHIKGDTSISVWGYCLVCIRDEKINTTFNNKTYYVVLDGASSSGIGEIKTLTELMKLSENYLIIGKCKDIESNIYRKKSELPIELQHYWVNGLAFINTELMYMQEQSAYKYLQDLELFPIQCFTMPANAPIKYVKSKQQVITLDGYDLTSSRRVSIILSDKNITGHLTKKLFTLKYLRILNLSNNNITGTIPNSINELSNLQELILSNNELEGEIPFTKGNLTNLTIINLNNNKLSGTIPKCIGLLSRLRTLNLSNNQLTGSIPMSIGNISKLEYLYLQDNQLSGKLPKLNKLEIISEIDFSNNNLEDPVVVDDLIGNNTNVIINLDGNKNIDLSNIPEYIKQTFEPKSKQKGNSEVTTPSSTGNITNII